MTHKKRTHCRASFLLCNMRFVIQQRHTMLVAVIALLMTLVILPEYAKLIQLANLRDEGGSGQAENFLHLAQAGEALSGLVINTFCYVQIDQETHCIQFVLPDVAFHFELAAAHASHVVAVGCPVSTIAVAFYLAQQALNLEAFQRAEDGTN